MCLTGFGRFSPIRVDKRYFKEPHVRFKSADLIFEVTIDSERKVGWGFRLSCIETTYFEVSGYCLHGSANRDSKCQCHVITATRNSRWTFVLSCLRCRPTLLRLHQKARMLSSYLLRDRKRSRRTPPAITAGDPTEACAIFRQPRKQEFADLPQYHSPGQPQDLDYRERDCRKSDQ